MDVSNANPASSTSLEVPQLQPQPQPESGSGTSVPVLSESVTPAQAPPAPDVGSGASPAPKAASKPKEPAVTFLQMFRYITTAETMLNVFACAAAIGNGIVFPVRDLLCYAAALSQLLYGPHHLHPHPPAACAQCFTLLFGQLLAAFNAPQTDFVGTINRYALYFFLLAIGAGLASFAEALPTITAERQVRRVRTAYLAALLRQDIAFYDTHKGGELAARLTEDALSMVGGSASGVGEGGGGRSLRPLATAPSPAPSGQWAPR